MTANKQLNIIVADDNRTFIEGLSVMLSKQANIKIIDKCYTGKELLNSKYLHLANLLLIDIEMPELDGLETAKRVGYYFPSIPMIALTMHLDKVYLTEIIMAGFKGFVHKPDVPKLLYNVIDKVLQNSFAFPDNIKIEKYGGKL